MLGRGTRVIKSSDLQSVTPDAEHKDHYLIIDAVGVVELPKVDTQTLERKRSIPINKLLEAVAMGVADEDTLSSLASRLAKLEAQLTPNDEKAIEQAIVSQSDLYTQRNETPPKRIGELTHKLLDAIDPDKIEISAKEKYEVDTPSDHQLETAKKDLVEAAVFPLAANPQLRNLIIEIQRRSEQLIDRVSIDTVLEAGYTADDALQTVNSFKEYIDTHKDEITALQLIFSQPYGLRQLTYQQIKELAEQLQQPPHSWTTQSLWLAYAKLEKDRVRGVGARRVLTDLVALVRHAVQMEDELVPFPEQVQARYEDWLAEKKYTEEQRWWLDRIVEHISVNLKINAEDLDLNPFNEKGGRFGVMRQFGPDFSALLDELNGLLVR